MNKPEPTPLYYDQIPLGVWTEPVDPKTGLQLMGQGASRFYRFDQAVKLDALEIPIPGTGEMSGAPRHLIITVYQDSLEEAKVVFDETIAPPDRNIIRIEMGGIYAKAASIFCDAHYSLPLALETLHPTTYTVPFYILEGVRWYGESVPGKRIEPDYLPPLQILTMEPKGIDGQTVEVTPYEVRFTSPYFSVGFGTVRPQMTFLSWDAVSRTSHPTNFLYRRVPIARVQMGNLAMGNGPYLEALHYDARPQAWNGEIRVEGNKVFYTNLHFFSGWRIDAEFEVGEKELKLHLKQTVDKELLLVDAAAWGFAWDGTHVTSVSANAKPIRGKRRNGGAKPRGAWIVPGKGSLNFNVTSSTCPVEFQIDNMNGLLFPGRQGYAGVQLNTYHHADGSISLLPGECEADIRFDVRSIEPKYKLGVISVHDGLRRAWGSIFTFRPEGGGFSNNSFQINCQQLLYFPADMAPYTHTDPDGPDVVELVRYAAELAVQGGPGYGCQWDQAMDTAPSLGISLTRVQQEHPDMTWLKDKWTYLSRPFLHILKNIDDTGLYVSAFRSGNSGEDAYSTNCMDQISFGHYDAYSNALAYRALKGGAILSEQAGDNETAQRCSSAAVKLKSVYAPILTNPETGLISGWKSADGELHDYACTYINGMAICYGLVNKKTARQILVRLEDMRLKLGFTDFRYGIPVNFIAIRRADLKLHGAGAPLREDGMDAFGYFINGSIQPTLGYFYLRALSLMGFKETADQICREVLESFEADAFEGGIQSGKEYYSWDGSFSGYEGTLAHSYHILLAVAQHMELVEIFGDDLSLFLEQEE